MVERQLMDALVTPPWAQSITPERPKPYGGPGQLTYAQFEYLFRERVSDDFNRARKTAKTWDEWEAFLAKWDAEHSLREPDEEDARSGRGRIGHQVRAVDPSEFTLAARY